MSPIRQRILNKLTAIVEVRPDIRIGSLVTQIEEGVRRHMLYSLSVSTRLTEMEDYVFEIGLDLCMVANGVEIEEKTTGWKS